MAQATSVARADARLTGARTPEARTQVGPANPQPSALDAAVAGYLDHLAVERGLAANSLAAYRRDLDRYRAFLATRGVRGPDDVAQQHVSAFLAAVRTGQDGGTALSLASAARTVVTVRGLHRFLLLDGVSEADPAAAVHPPSGPKRLPKAIPLHDVERLLDAAGAPGTPAALRDRALLEVLYGCGSRISEAVGLDVDDLDRADGVVRLLGKGSKERIVPIGSYATAALEAYLVRARPGFAARGRGTPAVFLNTRGGRLSRQSAWTVIGAAADRANLSAPVSPHTLRHCFATHLLEGGADVRVVQELLGHACVTTTQIYTKVTADTLREVYVAAHPRALAAS